VRRTAALQSVPDWTNAHYGLLPARYWQKKLHPISLSRESELWLWAEELHHGARTENKAGLCPQAATCDLRTSQWTHVASQTLADAGAIGLSQQQRKRVLAGSDPLFVDLVLAIDMLDDAVILRTKTAESFTVITQQSYWRYQ